MVQFSTVKASAAPSPIKQTGRPSVSMRQYEDFVNAVGADEAGKLTPEEGETTRSLAMRVARAAKRVGKTADTWTRDDAVYFIVS